MPYLGDYIGHLLSEITIARMNADLEAVRVAELYAGHPLLRNMPVPRFRLPDVEIDVPVGIRRTEERETDSGSRGASTVSGVRSVFDRVLRVVMARDGLRIEPEANRELKTALDDVAASVAQPAEIAGDMTFAASEFASVAARMLEATGRLAGDESREEIEKRFREEARREFLRIRRPPTRLDAIVSTAEIREAGPTEALTHIHLRVSEEGVEWTSVPTDDGKSTDRLVIE